MSDDSDRIRVIRTWLESDYCRRSAGEPWVRDANALVRALDAALARADEAERFAVEAEKLCHRGIAAMRDERDRAVEVMASVTRQCDEERARVLALIAERDMHAKLENNACNVAHYEAEARKSAQRELDAARAEAASLRAEVERLTKEREQFLADETTIVPAYTRLETAHAALTASLSRLRAAGDALRVYAVEAVPCTAYAGADALTPKLMLAIDAWDRARNGGASND